MKKEEIVELKNKYESACNAYARALCESWDISRDDTWWVGDTPCGGTFCWGDCHALNIEELIYVVENNVSLDTFLEYTDYCSGCLEFNFDTMSLKAYHTNAPRVPKETFDKLYKMKQDLDDAIKEEKQRQKASQKPLNF